MWLFNYSYDWTSIALQWYLCEDIANWLTMKEQIMLAEFEHKE